ncbi:hypothetical protein BLNAU_2089 [Blattamonas nauphoetae]|uniref:Uncharacterized protein n=1 Tax=Blattamonas nauphoetae TaxID=2049346 RepID=A0ABQ9YHB9_9EUKA|nr:hypothetical protein BLNAU_2089 [Blattamonas nauphoetae]
MLVDNTPLSPQSDHTIAQQTNYLKTILSMLSGDDKPVYPMMLNDLLAQATESDWALATIPDVEYIKPFEQYCEQIQPCDVPTSLPKLLTLIGKTSERECLRVCESSIPSFLLSWILSLPNEEMIKEIGECLLLWTSTLRSSSTFLTRHKTKFVGFIDHFQSVKAHFPHLKVLSQLCFSPHPEVSKVTLTALCNRSQSDSDICGFLQSDGVPSILTESSSEVEPFVKQLCGRMVEHVSQLKSFSAESSPSDETISGLSNSFHEESSLLTGDTVLEVLCGELSLVDSVFGKKATNTHSIPLNKDIVTVLKSTITACLDLLDQQKTESNCPPSDRTTLLIEILDSSWNCVINHLYRSCQSIFSEVPPLCFLLVRTYNRPSPTHSSRLGMIINFSVNQVDMVHGMLEENLIQRVIDTSKPTTVPTTHRTFHLDLIESVAKLIGTQNRWLYLEKDWKPLRPLQFERGLKPAKLYLQFILQWEEIISTWVSSDNKLPTIVTELLKETLTLERDLFYSGIIVETGREKWEVGWLVERTKEKDLGERLKLIRADDMEMKQGKKKKENERWKKRVERRREAGHEDAMEGWLTRRDNQIQLEVEEYVERMRKEYGMNNTM